MESFTKVKLIGSGGFGSVYLAKDLNDREVALKEIHLHGLTGEEKMKKIKEALLLKSLNHPHIIKYYSHVFTDDILLISLEFAANGNLKDFITARNGIVLDEGDILHIFSQILLSVNYLHGLNIVHRDLSGENVLVCNKNKIKLADFGLSKNLDVSQVSSGFVGHYCYMAPELFHGHRSTKETDIWSLGGLLYLLVALKTPFSNSSLADLMDIVRNKSKFYDLVDQLPENMHDIKKLIKLIMQIDPKNRPTSEMLLSHPLLALSVARIPLIDSPGHAEELVVRLRRLNNSLREIFAK